MHRLLQDNVHRGICRIDPSHFIPVLALLTFGVRTSPILTSVTFPVSEDSGTGALAHPTVTSNTELTSSMPMFLMLKVLALFLEMNASLII